VHCYPECIAEVSTRYKSTAAERRMWSLQWELHHCSIVYTVVKALKGKEKDMHVQIIFTKLQPICQISTLSLSMSAGRVPKFVPPQGPTTRWKCWKSILPSLPILSTLKISSKFMDNFLSYGAHKQTDNKRARVPRCITFSKDKYIRLFLN